MSGICLKKFWKSGWRDIYEKNTSFELITVEAG